MTENVVLFLAVSMYMNLDTEKNKKTVPKLSQDKN